MKMENANVEFVTFEAQDVIATSFYALGSQLNLLSRSFNGNQAVRFGYESTDWVRIDKGNSQFVADSYYRISENYTNANKTLTLDITEAPNVGAGTHEAYLEGSNTAAVTLNLLNWLKSVGTEQ